MSKQENKMKYQKNPIGFVLDNYQKLGRVFDPKSGSEHLKDQAFDSEKGTVVFDFWVFLRTQLIPVFIFECFACAAFSIVTTSAFAYASGVAVPLAVGLVIVVLANWFGVQLAMGGYGDVTKAHLSPVITTFDYIIHTIHFVPTGGYKLIIRNTLLVLSYYTAQFAGWFVGVGIVWYSIGDSSATDDLGLPKLGSVDGHDVGNFRAFFIETTAVTIYLMIYVFGVVCRRLPYDRAGHLLGITMGAIVIYTYNLTGANIIPLRWLTIFAVTGRPTSAAWGVYIFGPFVPLVFVIPTFLIWKLMVYVKDTDQSWSYYPEFPPENKMITIAKKQTSFINPSKKFTSTEVKEHILRNRQDYDFAKQRKRNRQY